MKYLKIFGILFIGLVFMNGLNLNGEVLNLSAEPEEQDRNLTPIVETFDSFKEDNFCWRETYGRGVGSIPTVCPNGKELDAGLCYTLCRSGYYGVGPVCYKSAVPEGFRDDGLYIAKPAPYGRGGGYAWLIGDTPFKNTGQMARCEKDYGKGNCEQDGALVYPKCKENYVKQGCCICSPKCPTGYQDIGVSCKKPNYGRGVGEVPTGCINGMDYNAGLCYVKCTTNYVGVGPVCWEVTCPNVNGKQWVDCGAGCAQSSGDCATAVIDMVTTPLLAVLNIAGMVVTAGGSGAATAGAGAAVTATTKAGKVIEYTTKAIEGGVTISKLVIENDLIAKAEELLNGQPMPAHQLKGIKEYAAMAYDASRTTTFDWRDFTSIDPTGLASVAAAYANPLCRDVKSNKRIGSTTTAVTTNIAKGKSSRQSSTLSNADGYSARYANDGIPQTLGGATIMCTNSENQPWWEVDLQGTFDISKITLHNRTNCCPDRLDKFTILVSNSPFTGNSGGATFTSNQAAPKGTKTYSGNAKGRYVRIYLNQKNYLSIPEIEIFGTPSN